MTDQRDFFGWKPAAAAAAAATVTAAAAAVTVPPITPVTVVQAVLP